MLKSANALTDRRSIGPVPPRMRRRCHCGCKRRATHTGYANNIAMTHGCELFVRRWVKSPREAIAMLYRKRDAQR